MSVIGLDLSLLKGRLPIEIKPTKSKTTKPLEIRARTMTISGNDIPSQFLRLLLLLCDVFISKSKFLTSGAGLAIDKR